MSPEPSFEKVGFVAFRHSRLINCLRGQNVQENSIFEVVD
jgi:hypothetical protein